jgi:hypothetical protein
MKPVGKKTKAFAGAIAVGVTFALVWSMAGLGYPQAAPAANLQLLASLTASKLVTVLR